jgi:acetyl-CoA carboxylase alpha subunit
MQYFVDNNQLLNNYKSNAREYATTYLDWENNPKPLTNYLKNIRRIPHENKKDIIARISSWEKREYARQKNRNRINWIRSFIKRIYTR